ncbi:MAG: hypothetical protein ACODAG_00110, partial [Myxococcota bacterium]
QTQPHAQPTEHDTLDSGIVDLHRLRCGASTTTALPLGREPARPDDRPFRPGAAVSAVVGATLMASSLVLAATMAHRSPEPASRTTDTGNANAAREGRLAWASEVPAPRMPLPEGTGVLSVANPEPETDVGVAAVEPAPVKGVAASPTSPMRSVATAPVMRRAGGPASASEPAPTASSSASARSEGLPDDLDALVERALRGGGEESAEGETPLPELPTRPQVATAMRSVSGPVRECVDSDAGIVTVRATADGPSGRITAVQVADDGLDARDRACIARAVENVELPPFERTGFAITFPY